MTSSPKTVLNKPAHLAALHIHHAYHSRGAHVLAVDEVSFALAPQTFTCLVGPSGCGKSTLLRILAGLLIPTSGTVQLGGEVLTRPQRRIGFVFQNPNLLPWRTVAGNLRLPLDLAGLGRAEAQSRINDMLALLGLSDFRRAYPSALSGGMAQRVAIGRALISQPEILLMDEPFGALDALTREYLSAELLRLWSHEQKTVLMVTHSLREAVLLADRVLVLSPRPARLVLDLPITLPRPRTLDLLTDAHFVALEAELRGALRMA